MPELYLEETIRRATKGSSQVTDVQATSDVIQNEGARTVTSEETRPAHTVTTTSTKAAVTVQSVKAFVKGGQVSFRVPFDLLKPINPTDASLGADC